MVFTIGMGVGSKSEYHHCTVKPGSQYDARAHDPDAMVVAGINSYIYILRRDATSQ